MEASEFGGLGRQNIKPWQESTFDVSTNKVSFEM